ncbi:HAMP domain-containing sensor histidine kinase [Streptosporangium sp. NPDC002544]|uniref:HAMP domain-containing sensor histidine kinase n=1 Tax=Streptosporangium sp. NPDC002544 TaxID=3154538 RepID=UPI0033170C18
MQSPLVGIRRLRARMFSSVRGRATLIAAGVTALTLAVCLILIWSIIRESTEDRQVDKAAAAARQLAAVAVVAHVPNPIPPTGSELMQLVEADGKVIAATTPMQGRPPMSQKKAVPGELRFDDVICPAWLNHCYHVTGIRVLQPTVYGRPLTALAAVPLLSIRDYLGTLTVLLLILLAVTAIVAASTWSVIGLAFQPVEAIRTQMADITATALDRRVPVPQTGGELQRLAETVNDTLQRLQNATERAHRFVSDASHDLRNPLAGLHSRIEVALTDPDDTELRPTLQAALHNTERLSNIVDDLLELSRLDLGAPSPLERLDLAELVDRELSRRPERIPVTVTLTPGVLVDANPIRLIRVLDNLLSNAERHARSSIQVVVGRDGDQAVLEVLDDGEGIPADAREKIFERFARRPEARRLNSGGTGLGLAIAREIAHAHGGTLTAHDSPAGGARFTLRLPMATRP